MRALLGKTAIIMIMTIISNIALANMGQVVDVDPISIDVTVLDFDGTMVKVHNDDNIPVRIGDMIDFEEVIVETGPTKIRVILTDNMGPPAH